MPCYAAPDDIENRYPPHPNPLPRRGEGKKLTNEIIPSPLMGKGEDEGKKTNLNPSLRGIQPFFGWMTWQSHLVIF